MHFYCYLQIILAPDYSLLDLKQAKNKKNIPYLRYENYPNTSQHSIRWKINCKFLKTYCIKILHSKKHSKNCKIKQMTTYNSRGGGEK